MSNVSFTESLQVKEFKSLFNHRYITLKINGMLSSLRSAYIFTVKYSWFNFRQNHSLQMEVDNTGAMLSVLSHSHMKNCLLQSCSTISYRSVGGDGQ